MSGVSSPMFEEPSRRAFRRHPLNVPLDLIALRSGVPEDLPGRCTDISESGLGAVVAGELSSGQQVAIELRLPRVAAPVRARAIVRHQARLQCGLELVGLSPDQKDMIRYWIYQSNLRNAEQPTKQTEIRKDSTIAAPRMAAVQASTASRPRVPTAFKLRPYKEFWRRLQTIRMSRRAAYSLVALFLLVAVVVWFRWEKAWNELERQDSSANAVVRIAPETMAMRVVTKVDPVYPEAARKLKTQGPVVLDAVIAPDGSVEKLRAISGPEILVPAAKAAVSSWKYEPYLLDGKRVRVGSLITVEFHPN
jgi:outer membrane biosynthesis protein TonB